MRLPPYPDWSALQPHFDFGTGHPILTHIIESGPTLARIRSLMSHLLGLSLAGFGVGSIAG